PFEFNYKKYLASKSIVHQIVIDKEQFVKIDSTTSTLQGIAAKFRKKVNAALKINGFSGNELAVINALLLGQRQYISRDVLENYAEAGAIHILAVSGLHVGILMLFLTYLFKPFTFFKNGKTYVLIITVVTLWLYAVVAGLSPSVVRAVTMFSFLSVGIVLKKQTNVYNTLSISFFVLLLINPKYIFEVGFQMSYLAVFFIVWLQPKIAKLLRIKNWLLNKVWQLFTVSIAAQIGVLPISLYYFHQFPGLFFISNIVIVPFLGFILAFGVLVIILSLLNSLPQFIAKSYNVILLSLNNFVEWIALQESFIIRNISFSLSLLLLSYTIFILFFLYVETKKVKLLLISLSCVIIFQSVLFYEKYIIENSTEFVAFNKTKNTILAIRNANSAVVYSNLDSIKSQTYPLKPYLTEFQIDSIQHKNIPTFLPFNNEIILIVNERGIYNYTTLKPTIVMLRNSPKINLERLITHLNPKLIIADASNYKSFVKRWRVSCIKKETPFYSTSQKGAFIKKMM
ncbi:MAG TPA: ComEC/Rec2 family competence protein, partial [Flavobacteriaceae bacterium]|nr:ComEC/Rec2 family competence protein [Flavobacteriaceae bacterium]